MKRLALGLGLVGAALGVASGCDDTRPVVGLPPDGQAGEMSQGGEAVAAGAGGAGAAQAGTNSAGSPAQGGDLSAAGMAPSAAGADTGGPSVGGQGVGGQAPDAGGAGGAAAP